MGKQLPNALHCTRLVAGRSRDDVISRETMDKPLKYPCLLVWWQNNTSSVYQRSVYTPEKCWASLAHFLGSLCVVHLDTRINPTWVRAQGFGGLIVIFNYFADGCYMVILWQCKYNMYLFIDPGGLVCVFNTWELFHLVTLSQAREIHLLSRHRPAGIAWSCGQSFRNGVEGLDAMLTHSNLFASDNWKHCSDSVLANI